MRDHPHKHGDLTAFFAWFENSLDSEVVSKFDAFDLDDIQKWKGESPADFLNWIHNDVIMAWFGTHNTSDGI